MIGKAVSVVVTIFWVVFALPTLLLMIGFSNGSILSPAALVEGLVETDPLVLYNIAAWAILLWPALLIWLAVCRRSAGEKS